MVDAPAPLFNEEGAEDLLDELHQDAGVEIAALDGLESNLLRRIASEGAEDEML